MTKEPEDEIAEEIRHRRERHADAFDYDLERITKDLQRREKESSARIVERPSRKPTGGPDGASNLPGKDS